MNLELGKPAALHVNLNKQCISIKQGSNPVQHLFGVTVELSGVTWSCPPKGFETATRQRHVFAKMRGVLVAIHDGDAVPSDAPRVRLNSKDRPQFPFFHVIDGPHVSRVDRSVRGWLRHEMGAPYPVAFKESSE